jgi:hypothetical protein
MNAETQIAYALNQHQLCCEYLNIPQRYDVEGGTLLESLIALEKDRDEWKEESGLHSKESDRLAKKIDAIETKALEITPGYGNTGKSTFSTPIAVMGRMRDEIDLLRKELASEQEKALDWFIEFHALKNAVDETLEENRHLADGDNCTLKKLKDAYAKAKNAGHGLDSENAEL